MAENGHLPPVALSAFLRGVERRGALLAQLQCGDAEAGDVALSAAMRAFRRQAAGLPLPEWPAHFWSLLAAVPTLRQDALTANWPKVLGHLQTLDLRDRAALLLRLAAGLGEEQAAEVLGLDLPHYRQALASACPRHADGEPDVDAWRRLADAIQQLLRDLPPDRLARLARLRESALSGERMSRPMTAQVRLAADANRNPPRRSRRWLGALAVVVLCGLAIAATFHWPLSWPGMNQAIVNEPQAESGLGLAEEPDIRQEELPPADPPATRFDEAFVAASHPDFELLMQPDEEAVAREADFLAWYLAGQAEHDSTHATQARLPMELQQRASRWEALDPIQRAHWQQRMAAWDALLRQEREDRRARFAAWKALDEVQRARLRTAAVEVMALPSDQQQALRTQFSSLDEMQRRGWRLGPALGGDFASLQPLFGFVPAAEREASLTLLQQLDAAQRDDLAMLAQRIPPQDRDAFRRQLLQLPAAERSGWLKQQRDQ